MKKLTVLLSAILLFMTGCSVVKLNDNNIEKNIDTIMSEKGKLHNVYYDGYKYYLPKGINFVSKDDFNAVLKDRLNNKYYLYVDVIGYYNKVKNSYEENYDLYLSKKIKYNKKDGYIQIEEIDSKYFIQYVYNYVKIEAYVSKEDLNDVIINLSYILNSVKYNDKVLESLVGDNVLDYKEVEYNLFKADSSKESFLDVVEREETDKYKKDIEDEKIELED
ncbi:MAG: hypothetical protein IKE63_05505 [Bacilli bacterium]|nr:hypothetical protein [Bacilli bacterium]